MVPAVFRLFNKRFVHICFCMNIRWFYGGASNFTSIYTVKYLGVNTKLVSLKNLDAVSHSSYNHHIKKSVKSIH